MMQANELRIECDECGGSGIVAEITCEPKCCGRTTEYGDCCNNPIPDWRIERAQCHKCIATGYIEINEELKQKQS